MSHRDENVGDGEDADLGRGEQPRQNDSDQKIDGRGAIRRQEGDAQRFSETGHYPALTGGFVIKRMVCLTAFS